MADISIRALGRDEEELGMRAIALLFRDSHILARNKEFFHWQFGTFGRDAEPGFWLAEAEGAIVGCIGGVPVDCHDHGRRFPGIITGDYAVAPDYRRGGLALRLFDAACRGRMIVAIGVSDANMQICRQIRGMHIMNAMPRYVCVTNRDKLASLLEACGNGKAAIEEYRSAPRFKMGAGASGHAADILSPAVLPEWDECWGKKLAPRLGGVVKDAAYIEWRYLSHPVFKYIALVVRDAKRDVRGLAVVRNVILPNGMAVLRILEFLSAGTDAGAALARGIGELVGDDVVYLEFMGLGRQWEPLAGIGVGPAGTMKFSYYFTPPNLDFCDITAVFFHNTAAGMNSKAFCAGEDAYITIGDSDMADAPYWPRQRIEHKAWHG